MEKLKLLIVDDELGIRLGAKRVLKNFSIKLSYLDEDYGFEVDEAETGEIGIEKLRENNYDILLLDNKLPGIHGTEVLELIKKEDIEVMTIMITAFASLETAVIATRNGAYDFVTKPFSPEELRSSIEKGAKSLILTKMTKKFSDEKKKVRFEFIRTLSHELKSPIAAVEGYLNIITNRLKGDALAEYDTMIDRSVIRIHEMRKLVNDMLDLTSIESGQKKRNIEKINLFELSSDIISSLEQDLKKKEVSIDLICNKETEINGDRSEFEIIIRNLVSNAIKYNIDRGTVELSILIDDNQIEIICKDSGIGLTEEEKNRLFAEFTRIKNEKTKGIAGSGLGLSIIKKIIDLNDGTIEVTSKPDEGTTFKILM